MTWSPDLLKASVYEIPDYKLQLCYIIMST